MKLVLILASLYSFNTYASGRTCTEGFFHYLKTGDSCATDILSTFTFLPSILVTVGFDYSYESLRDLSAKSRQKLAVLLSNDIELYNLDNNKSVLLSAVMSNIQENNPNLSEQEVVDVISDFSTKILTESGN